MLANGIYLPRIAFGNAMAAAAAGPAANDAAGRPEFSERQFAVLQRLLQGKANKVIARELNIAEGTVKAHLWAIYQTLGVSSRAQAMYRAHELRLFELQQR